MTVPPQDARIAAKMQAAGVAEPTRRAFLAAVARVRSGERGFLPESTIAPVESVPGIDGLPPAPALDPALRRALVVLKLNGGLGTGMGLAGAKSLIAVKGAETFLDFIARQIVHLRRGGREPAFYLMDSYTTQAATLAWLGRHPGLDAGEPLDFLQSRVPRLEASTLDPVEWPAQPELEWCPPGHGDLYPSLVGSGLLDRLLARGIRYAFVSNSDNLGATVDARLVRHFAASGLSFLMEVAERTAADRKGGHLARRRDSGRLVLRESAQTPAADEASFQDIQRHRFFNTNNLWIRLDDLAAALAAHDGVLPLPLITNTKTVDPRDPGSRPVLQLESAMGAAIECFERSGAVQVGRDRFSPVKTTSDLLAVRSDAYEVTEDQRLVLAPARSGVPPAVELDPAHYRVLAEFERWFPHGAPSLVRCSALRVTGPVRFEAGVVCQGRVAFLNRTGHPVTVAAGLYRDEERAW